MAHKLKAADVIVVGAGVAGTIICMELAQAGLRVVGLERGRMINPKDEFAMPYAHDELKYERHSNLIQDLSRETITFRNTIGETALPMREIGAFKPGECVGGAGVHWSGVTFRFLPWDFKTKSLSIARYGAKQLPPDCTSQDWGLTYDELEPCYDKFECIYGVGGEAGNIQGEIKPGGNPFEGPRSRAYPNPAAPMATAGANFANAAKTLGYRPFPTPTAAMTRPYVNPYGISLAQCVRGGFCTGFGCAMGAKGSPLTTVLPALLENSNFELRTKTTVTKINLNSDKTRAVSVIYYDAQGREIEQPAELIVLSAFTLNNTRLMLLSGIGEPYDPVSNRGVVGRNYSYPTSASVALFFEDRVFNNFIGGGGLGTVIDEFNGDNFDHTGLDFIGGAFMGVLSNGAPPIRSHPVPPGTPSWGAEWKKAVAQYYNNSMVISVNGGCQSYRMNYLDLDPTYRDAYGLPLMRMTFDYGESDRRMLRYMTNKGVEIAQSIGPSKMSISNITGKYSIVQSQSTHNAGGAIVGEDPQTSALNKYLQSWDVANLFVIGASAFPQNSGSSPTGTVGALAFWTAQAIKDRYLKRPGPLA